MDILEKIVSEIQNDLPSQNFLNDDGVFIKRWHKLGTPNHTAQMEVALMDFSGTRIEEYKTKDFGVSRNELLVRKMPSMQGRTITPFLLTMDQKEKLALEKEKQYYQNKAATPLCEGAEPFFGCGFILCSIGFFCQIPCLGPPAGFPCLFFGGFALMGGCVRTFHNASENERFRRIPSDELGKGIALNRLVRLYKKIGKLDKQILNSAKHSEEWKQLKEARDFFQSTVSSREKLS